jgi:hypothetical protein
MFMLGSPACNCLQTAQQWEEQGYVDPESMADLPEDEETLGKVRSRDFLSWQF